MPPEGVTPLHSKNSEFRYSEEELVKFLTLDLLHLVPPLSEELPFRCSYPKSPGCDWIEDD
jgi:hypothetical protein